MSILLNRQQYKKALSLIRKYPKKRPTLNKKLKKIFNFEYKKNRTNFLSQLSESWLHFSIKGRKDSFNKSLEIGAGTLNHMPYEKMKNNKYDVIEPKKFLYKNNKNKILINRFYNNLNIVPNNKYDRIISCAVLEHLEDLPKYLYLSTKKLKKNGYQSHSIPCEGFPVWDIAWYLMSGITFKIRTGQNFSDVQKHEHINNYDEILSLITFFYKKIRIRFSYPGFFTPFLSLYANITFSEPNKINIETYKRLKKKPKLYKK
jgi:hypothetical protein